MKQIMRILMILSFSSILYGMEKELEIIEKEESKLDNQNLHDYPHTSIISYVCLSPSRQHLFSVSQNNLKVWKVSQLDRQDYQVFKSPANRNCFLWLLPPDVFDLLTDMITHDPVFELCSHRQEQEYITAFAAGPNETYVTGTYVTGTYVTGTNSIITIGKIGEEIANPWLSDKVYKLLVHSDETLYCATKTTLDIYKMAVPGNYKTYGLQHSIDYSKDGCVRDFSIDKQGNRFVFVECPNGRCYVEITKSCDLPDAERLTCRKLQLDNSISSVVIDKDDILFVASACDLYIYEKTDASDPTTYTNKKIIRRCFENSVNFLKLDNKLLFACLHQGLLNIRHDPKSEKKILYKIKTALVPTALCPLSENFFIVGHLEGKLALWYKPCPTDPSTFIPVKNLKENFSVSLKWGGVHFVVNLLEEIEVWTKRRGWHLSCIQVLRPEQDGIRSLLVRGNYLFSISNEKIMVWRMKFENDHFTIDTIPVMAIDKQTLSCLPDLCSLVMSLMQFPELSPEVQPYSISPIHMQPLLELPKRSFEMFATIPTPTSDDMMVIEQEGQTEKELPEEIVSKKSKK